jgi:DNA-binding transcriptional MerR regulator
MLIKKDKLLSISEVAFMFGLVNKNSKKPSTHTLRFWETKFKQLRPTILNGGRRYYSSKDIKVLKMIFFFLKERGLTINGAIKAMNENLKKLDDTKSSSIKAEYYLKTFKKKTKDILLKIKKING